LRNMADSISIPDINAPGSFQDINGVKTHICETGAGTPLILIHGFMGTYFDWRRNIPELARHFAVIAFDLPGFGYSNKPVDFPYTADGYASFLVDLMNKLNINKAILVGNSLGEIILSMTSTTAVRYMLGHILKNKSSVTGDIVSYYYNVYKTANARNIPPAVIRNVAVNEIEITARLKEIYCPVLIVWGAEDNVIPVSYAHMFKRSILNSSLLIIDEAGHLPQIDKAESVNQAVRDFLRV